MAAIDVQVGRPDDLDAGYVVRPTVCDGAAASSTQPKTVWIAI